MVNRKNILLLGLLIFSARIYAAENFIRLSAVGDIMMGTTYPQNWLPSDEGRSFFAEAAPFLQAADIRFGNFEGTFFSGPPQPDGKAPGPNRYLFQTPPEYVSRLTEAQFNVVSLANNHSHDFGRAGLDSTKEVLSRAGILFSSKDGEVAHFEVRGVKIALIAVDYKQGARSLLNVSPILEEIRRLKTEVNIVVVSGHVGAEGRGAGTTPDHTQIFLGQNRGNSVSFSHQAIEAGADAIILHGPHVPRGIEIYRGRIILYSLGNFATGQGISISGVSALAPLAQLQLAEDGRFVSGQIISFIQSRTQGTILDGQNRALENIRELSQIDFPHSAPQFSSDGIFAPQP